MSEDFGTRLSRWSQRKRAARRGTPVEEAPEALRGDEQVEPPVADAPVDGDAALEQAPDLPPVDELTAESDYTVFLGQNVPEALKRAALHKLWRSDPMLANLDGLNDYDEDFNAVETLADSLRSAYRVGKGYAEEAEEKLARLESGEDGEDAESLPAASEAEEDAAGCNAANERCLCHALYFRPSH
ncbi:MAG: DUF3306 domain-containing protein [Pseudolabrys sp.]